jgi:hypothetical protein
MASFMKQILYFLSLGTFFGIGCATSPTKPEFIKTPQQIYQEICSIGDTLQSAQGSVLIKTNSKEVTGQFPATVSIQNPQQLRLEVTNFLGGTEAIINVLGDRYEVLGQRGGATQRETGYGTWGGIPLRWASDLFLGKIPCPVITQTSQLKTNEKGELEVVIPGSPVMEAQKFTYRLEEKAGRFWPTVLRWERMTTPILSVDFKFDDPEKQTRSPQRWEANSSRGTVKVRWRDREAINKNETLVKPAKP